jgi:hypothetical protein
VTEVPIRRMYYSGRSGSDIHLLRDQDSQSRDLRVDLQFVEVLPDGSDNEQSAEEYLDDHPAPAGDVRLEFRPTFTAPPPAGDEWTNFGIKVNRLSGEVTFENVPAPNPAPFNFIIEAVITQNTGGIPPADIDPVPIRVHVHDAATRMWLTPQRLTVRRLTAAGDDETDYRFTARVEFSDGIVGDLTAFHDLSWAPPANTHIDDEGQDGLLLIPAGVPAGTVVPITAEWTNAAGSLNATADMVVAPPWAADPAMPRAEIVDGHPDTWAGTINPEVVPNVLFFGDGFTGPDHDRFRAITNKIAHDLKTDPMTTPYDRLATSMNYWRVMVPSAGRGVSVRCEVYTFTRDGRLVARAVPPARVPPAPGDWEVEHLIYAVGLPMPTDVPPAGEGGAQATARRAALRTRWTAIVRDAPTPARVSDAVIDEWARLGTRTFIDEIDSFPAMCLGEPPTAANTAFTPSLELHPDRGGNVGLRSFYRALGAANGVAIAGPGPGNNLGIVWAENRDPFRFDNRSLVVLLAAHKGGRAQRTARHIDISLKAGNLRIPVTATMVAGRRVIAIDGTVPLPMSVDRKVWRTTAHELCHSFGLGDEYVEGLRRFTAPEEDLNEDANLTSESAVVSAGRFRSDLIKWNWRRARKAAVLRELILPPSGTEFDIEVLTGQAFQFAAGDKVRLRAREWKTVIGFDPFECPTELEVVSHNAAGDVITVRGSPSDLDLTMIPVGSVVYVPVPMPDGSPGEARMIAPKVAQYIDDNNRPLTPWPCDPAAQIGDDDEGNDRGKQPQVPGFDLFSGLWSHRNDVRVVGLYAGGDQHACGIFHPAGDCMMRRSKTGATGFCAVCRFVLVDTIDPDKHWWIDREYDSIYPD